MNNEEHYYLATLQYKAEATKWLDLIKHGENVSVIFAPKTDRFIRLRQLLNDYQVLSNVFKNPQDYILLRIDFDAHDVEDMSDLTTLLAAQVNLSKLFPKTLTFEQLIKYLDKQNLVLVLIVAEAEKFLTQEGRSALSLLSQLTESNENIRIISFFETDITHPSILPILPSSTQLYENVFRYPLYTEEHTLNFIQLLKKLYEVSLDKAVEKDIVRLCGGHFWLVKEAVRNIKMTGKWNPKEEGLWFRMRTIYNLFLPSERTLLEKVVRNKTTFTQEEEISRNHLVKMRILTDKDVLQVGLFSEFIGKDEMFKGELKVINHHIIFNQIPIDIMFSRQEQRVIKLFIEQANKLVTRDEVAARIWTTNVSENYSDWAIDRLMSRIRKRLLELSVPPRLLQVVRGKGYIFKI